MTRGFTVIETLIVIAICLIVAAAVFMTHKRRSEFREACSQRGGETVHDGRQWQCMPKVNGSEQ